MKNKIIGPAAGPPSDPADPVHKPRSAAVPAASCGGVSPPAPTPGETPGELPCDESGAAGEGHPGLTAANGAHHAGETMPTGRIPDEPPWIFADAMPQIIWSALPDGR